MKFQGSSLIGIIGVVVGLLGIVGPISWDYYRTKEELKVSLIDQSQVIGQFQKIDGLKISYHGSEVDELSKATLLIQNTGRTPIMSKDVVSPLFIKFGRESILIDVKLIRTDPSDLVVHADYEKAPNGVFIDFPLLNSGDRAWLNVLYQGDKLNFTTSGRIAGLSNIVEDINPPSVRDKSKPPIKMVIFVGIITIFMLILGVVGLVMTAKEYRYKVQIKSGKFSLPLINSKVDLANYVISKFDFTTDKERQPLLNKIYAFNDEDGLSKIHEKEIFDGISELLNKSMTNVYFTLILLFICAIGIYYIVEYFK